ncbi:cyclic nucleotide-binding domain-containing protein [Rhodobacterales bacterium HKCCSP123]|nr:cyclic nucleotide-binding domain-containing protein [Rhodobacterales bacterium HKCCSP123]
MEPVTVIIESLGWIASGLTIATYAMNTMLLLRVLAILSSVFFLAYGTLLGLWPLVAMEATLLPINIYRLWQLLSLRRKVARSSGARADFDIVRRYGKRRTAAAGTILFRKGDKVDRLYLLSKGRVRIEEMGIEIQPGDIFGEIAFFTEDATRTATARAIDDVEIYDLDETRFLRLQFEDPGFGLAVMRTVTRRLMEGNDVPPSAEVRPAAP